jgi:hypothetical protein
MIAAKCPKCNLIGYCICENKPIIYYGNTKEKSFEIKYYELKKRYDELLEKYEALVSKNKIN